MVVQVTDRVLSPIIQAVEYPESDGQPMGESETHVLAILHLLQALRHFFRNRADVYVIADMFLYYEEGNPNARKAPDVMVVKGVDKRVRRIFKLWEEQVAPCVIFEITSRDTWMEDLVNKSTLYASLGVAEYFLFDPLRECLGEPLLGFRLVGREYVPIPPNPDGSLSSVELGASVRPEESLLRVIDPQTGKYVPALDEAILLAEQAAQEARQAAQEARRAAQEARQATQRADAAEAEVARLQALLAQLQGRAGVDREQPFM